MASSRWSPLAARVSLSRFSSTQAWHLPAPLGRVFFGIAALPGKMAENPVIVSTHDERERRRSGSVLLLGLFLSEDPRPGRWALVEGGSLGGA